MKQEVGGKRRRERIGNSRNGEKESGGEATIPKSEDGEITLGSSDKVQQLAPSIP